MAVNDATGTGRGQGTSKGRSLVGNKRLVHKPSGRAKINNSKRIKHSR